jgi:hypothetical protein
MGDVDMDVMRVRKKRCSCDEVLGVAGACWRIAGKGFPPSQGLMGALIAIAIRLS